MRMLTIIDEENMCLRTGEFQEMINSATIEDMFNVFVDWNKSYDDKIIINWCTIQNEVTYNYD